MMSVQQLAGGWPLSGVTTSWVAVLATIIFTAFYLSSRKTHTQEPPVITPAVPFVGHLLGMALQGGHYIKSIGYEIKTNNTLMDESPRER